VEEGRGIDQDAHRSTHAERAAERDGQLVEIGVEPYVVVAGDPRLLRRFDGDQLRNGPTAS
jgi:hypothetical protein